MATTTVPLPAREASEAQAAQPAEHVEKVPGPSTQPLKHVSSLPLQLPLAGLDQAILETQPCLLRPLGFMVSWNGVLCLAYSGYPPSLARLKQRMAALPGLPPEYPGSKWPKTSLAALRDGLRLTPAQLSALNAAAQEVNTHMFGWQPPAAEGPQAQEAAGGVDGDAVTEANGGEGMAVLVDRLNATLYTCRTLECRLMQHVVPLAGDGGALDVARPGAAEAAHSAGILAESLDEQRYWFHASRDGSREAHYKATHLGLTLIHDLQAFHPGPGPASSPSSEAIHGTSGQHTLRYGWQLPSAVRAFRAAVDAALPGMYVWFPESSLHVTVRSLLG